MDVHYPPIESEATPEYVLAVLRDAYRHELGIDDGDTREWLFFDTTIAEWRADYESYCWESLAEDLNKQWQIDCSPVEWRSVLEKDDVMCLHDVCNLIARHARKLEIRPSRMLGVPCRTAGAFLTVRSLLHQAGASAEEITPSTPLAPYTRKYPEVFLGPIARLAPGVLPSIEVILDDATLCGYVFESLSAIAVAFVTIIALMVMCVAPLVFGVAAFLVVLFCWSLHLRLVKWLGPWSVEFGGLRTFRDLSRVLAGPESELTHQIQ